MTSAFTLAPHRAGDLSFFSELTGLADHGAFTTYLAPLRKIEWVVYAKPPFGGPEAALAYLRQYVHYRLLSAMTHAINLAITTDMLLERGIDISHKIARFWCNKFGPKFAS
jgi:hypothetical protein